MMLMQFNWLDYCLIGFILFSVVIGLQRGLVQEISSIANWVLGLWGGIIFYDSIEFILPNIVQPIELRYFISFCISFGVILVGITWLTRGMQWVIISAGLRGPDKILGVLLGAVRGVVFIVLLMAVAESAFGNASAFQYSQLIMYLKPFKDWFINFIPYHFDGVIAAT